MRETILIDALNEIIKMDWDNWQSKEIARKALSDLASAPKEGLRWVRASENENLPIAGKSVICLYGPKGLDKWEVVFADRKNISFLAMEKNGFDVKWLDESPAPKSGGEEWHPLDDERSVSKFNKSNTDVTPESGGEETYWKNRCIAAEELIDINSKEKQPDNFKRWEGLVVASPTKEDFVPSVQSSDVTPVASHSVYDNNSIEQFIGDKALYEREGTVIWGHSHDKLQHLLDLREWDDDYEVTHWMPLPAPPNSEQEDKRSVATKSNQGGDAGNQTYLPKEEGKDEEQAAKDYIAIKAENWDLKTEIERLNGLMEKAFEAGREKQWPSNVAPSDKNLMFMRNKYSSFQQFAKENGLKGEGENK